MTVASGLPFLCAFMYVYVCMHANIQFVLYKVHAYLHIVVTLLIKICTVMSVADGLLRMAISSTVSLSSLTKYVNSLKLIIIAIGTR